MTYFARITDRTTGTSKTKTFDEAWDGASDFDWGDNNRSCDCNRAIYFEDAGGQLPDTELPCGDWRFTVCITDEAGRVLFDDTGTRLKEPPYAS